MIIFLRCNATLTLPATFFSLYILCVTSPLDSPITLTLVSFFLYSTSISCLLCYQISFSLFFFTHFHFQLGAMTVWWQRSLTILSRQMLPYTYVPDVF